MIYNSQNKMQIVYKWLDDSVNCILPLYDLVEIKVLKRLDYDTLSSLIPLWMMDAGSSEESSWSKDLFDKFRSAYNCKTVNRVLYYFDLAHLLSALQDRFRLVKGALSNVYWYLTYPTCGGKYVTAIRNSDLKVASITSELYSVYIYLCSSMDLLTKIIFELENMEAIDFNSYPKLRSENINYKRSYSFVKKFTGGNLFTPTISLYEIIELRNRIIHNGGFDYSLWIYDCFTKDDKVESVIFLPDTIDGHIVKSVNRRNFYSQSRTANSILVEHVLDFCFLFMETVKQTCTLYKTEDISDKRLTERYLTFVMNKLKKISHKDYDSFFADVANSDRKMQ